jgi:hypothetical protein
MDLSDVCVLAEVANSKKLFADILRLIGNLRAPPAASTG